MLCFVPGPIRMYIAGLFLLFLVTMLLAWLGRRDHALILFGISLVLTVAVYFHHATDPLNIGL